MRIDFSREIHDLAGKPISENGVPVTLGSVCSGALLMPYPDERNVSGEDKVKRFRLAEKVYAGGLQDITVEDAALLKQLLAKAYTPLIVGRAYGILESAAA